MCCFVCSPLMCRKCIILANLDLDIYGILRYEYNATEHTHRESGDRKDTNDGADFTIRQGMKHFAPTYKTLAIKCSL